MSLKTIEVLKNAPVLLKRYGNFGSCHPQVFFLSERGL